MTGDEVLAHLEQWITATYPTGLAWMGIEDGTLDIEWADGAAVQIAVDVRNFDPSAHRWVMS